MKACWYFTFCMGAALAMVSCASRRAIAGEGHSASLESAARAAASAADTSGGQALFLRNCAHCHGADAHGDEGPDLHHLEGSDAQLAARIRNGKKGQMTAFAGKLAADEINDVVAYLRTLK